VRRRHGRPCYGEQAGHGGTAQGRYVEAEPLYQRALASLFEGSQDLTRGARVTRVDEGTTGGDS
jgi:hypothetical protein